MKSKQGVILCFILVFSISKLYSKVNVSVLTQVYSSDYRYNQNETPNGIEVANSTKTMYDKLGLSLFVFHSDYLKLRGYNIVNRTNQDIVAGERSFQKSESFIDGISQKSKSIGADQIFFLEGLVGAEKLELHYRFIDVTSSKVLLFFSLEINLNDLSSEIKNLPNKLNQKLDLYFPEQYTFVSNQGDVLKFLNPNEVALKQGDEISVYIKSVITEGKDNFTKLEFLGSSIISSVSGNFFELKLKKNFNPNEDKIIACKSNPSILYNTPSYYVSIIELPVSAKKFNYKLKNYINTNVTEALYSIPSVKLIEKALMSEIIKEKETQKGSDYIDGYTVNQYKNIGAKYLIYIEFISGTDNVEFVNFTLKVLDIEKNEITDQIPIYCKKSEIFNTVVSNMINVFPQNIKFNHLESSEIEIYSKSIITNNSSLEYIVESTNNIDVQGKNYVERKTIGQLKLIELNGNFMRMKIIDGKKEILQCLSNPDKNKNLLLKIKK